MQLTLTIPEDTYARLSEWAAARDQSVQEAVPPLLDQALPPPAAPTPEDRRRAFEELIQLVQARADRYPPGFRVDDSRESIYRGCGE